MGNPYRTRTVRVEGSDCEVLHDFGAGRMLVNFNGLPVFVDATSMAEWELSGEPAREDEKEIYRQFVGPDGTTVVVTNPDGGSTTFND